MRKFFAGISAVALAALSIPAAAQEIVVPAGVEVMNVSVSRAYEIDRAANQALVDIVFLDGNTYRSVIGNCDITWRNYEKFYIMKFPNDSLFVTPVRNFDYRLSQSGYDFVVALKNATFSGEICEVAGSKRVQ